METSDLRPLLNRLKPRRAALNWMLLALGVGSAPSAFSQAIDESFNPEPPGIVYALALQPYNKILIGGSDVVRRLHPDGSTDTSFNTALIPGDEVYCFAVQPDGKIALGGGFSSLNGSARTNLGRLHPDGSLDALFTAQAGRVNPWIYEWVNSLDIQTDGKILVAGYLNVSGLEQPLPSGLFRFHADGTSDLTFNPAPGNVPTVVLVQPDGKILTGRLGVDRLLSDGSLDPAFTPAMGNASILVSLALQADGKILVGGDFSSINGQPRSRMARLHPDGLLDQTFHPEANGSVSSFALQADGCILVAGQFTGIDGQPRPGMGRLNPDGRLDETFGPVPDAKTASLALQADGNILASGFFGPQPGQRTTLARFTNPTPAVQTLVLDCTTTKLTWSRGGSAPEVSQVTFEQSLDGVSYGPLGNGTRVSGGWELAGVSLPAGQAIYIRARGRVAGMLGAGGNSTGLIESIQQFRSPNGPVLGARGVIRCVGSELDHLRHAAISPVDRIRLKHSADNLRRAAALPLWLDEIHLNAGGGQRIFHALAETVRTLEALRKDRHSRLPAAEVQPLIDRLVEAARWLAVAQLDTATGAGPNSRKLRKAREELLRGDREEALRNHDGAIQHYEYAWRMAARLEGDDDTSRRSD